MGPAMFYNYLCFQEGKLKGGEDAKNEENQQPSEAEHKSERNDLGSVSQNEEEGWWHMDFDGVMSKEGAGVGIWVRSPKDYPKVLSYKLYFDYTNNVVEYEALVLGLKMLKVLKTKKVYIYGDYKLIINKVKGIYQTKH